MNELLQPYPVDESNEGLGSVEKVDYEDLLSDLIDHDSSYKNPQGNIEGKIGETVISFQYTKPKLLNLIKDRVSSSDNGELDEKTYRDSFLGVYTDIRLVKDLKIYNSENTLDLKEIFGKDNIKIYFNLSLKNGTGGFNDKKGIIWLAENPLTRGGLVTLLHEIGHYKNSKEKTDKEKRRLRDASQRIKFSVNTENIFPPTEEDAGLLMAEERKAWEVAIDILTPMAKNLKFDLDEVDQDDRLKCLQSYEDIIADVIKK